MSLAVTFVLIGLIVLAGIGTFIYVFVNSPSGDYDFVSPLYGCGIGLLVVIGVLFVLAVKGCVGW